MTAIGLVITLILIAAPWPFASVAPTVHRWWMLAIAVALGSNIIQHVGQRLRQAPLHASDPHREEGHKPCCAGIRWVDAIIVMALLWAGLQLVPLPSPLVEQLSPQTQRVWAMSRSRDEPLAGPSWMRVSLQPEATFRSLALFGMACGGFVLAARFASVMKSNGNPIHRPPATIRAETYRFCIAWLPWWALVGTGLALSVFGIVQQLTWNGRIYWRYTFPWVADPFGPIVNRNNAAGCLNMAIGGCVVGLAWALWDRTLDRRLRHALLVSSIGAAAVMVAGILRSGSRGGLLSLVLASIIVAISVSLRRSRRPLLGLVAVCLPLAAGLALAIWLSTDPRVWERYGTLQKLSTYRNDGRVVNWGAAYRAWREFPLTGTGYGTYRYAYQPFEQRDAGQWLVHAENVFVETLLEGGMPGLMLLVTGLGYLASVFLRSLGRSTDSRQSAVAAGGLYVLASQTAHNCMDLGAYVPANLLWGSLTLGLAYGACCGTSNVERPARVRNPVLSIELLLLVVITTCTYVYWPYAEVGRLVRRMQRVEERNERLDRYQLESLEKQFQLAIARYPNNAEAHLELAKIQVQLWQQMARSETAANLKPESQPSLETLYARAVLAVASADGHGLDSLRSEPTVERYLLEAYRHAEAARRNCPLMARAHLLAGQLAWVATDRFTEVPYLRWAAWCARANPAIQIPVGAFEWLGGHRQRALERFRQVAKLDRRLGEQLAEIYRAWVDPTEILADRRPMDEPNADQ